MIEEWRQIPDFPDYEVSSLGRVRKGDRYLSLASRIRGYVRVSLYSHKKSASARVHRLVLEAFVGSCPEGCEGAHLNGIRDDNRAENLAWVTAKENSRHRILHGTQVNGEGHGRAKVTAADVEYIRQNYRPRTRQFGSIALGKRFGLSRDSIENIVKGETWNPARHRKQGGA